MYTEILCSPYITFIDENQGDIMKSVIKHIVINLFEKKFRTFIVLLTVCLSTLVVFIGLSLNGIIKDTYASMLKGAYGDTNIIMSKSSDNPLYEKHDIVLPDIPIETRNDMLFTQGKTTIKDKKIDVILVGLDAIDAEASGLLNKTQQMDGFKLQQNRAMISNNTAAKYDLQLGDPISIDTGEEKWKFIVGAISKTQGVFFSEVDAISLAVSQEQVNNILDTTDKVNTSYLTVPENKLSEAIQFLKTNNADFHIQNQSTAANAHDGDTFETTMILAILTIVLISSYIIFSLAKLIVVERMPVVGTFRSIGASKKLIHFILTLEFLFYGLIGSIIGFTAGMLLLPYVADLFNAYKDLGVETEVSYSFTYICIAFLFGALFPAVISHFQISRLNKRPLKEIILNTQQTSQKHSIIPYILGLILLITAFGLYGINQKDDLLLGILSILCLFISIVLWMPGFLNLVSKGLNRLFQSIGSGEFLLGVKNLGNNKIASNNSNMIIVVFILLMLVGMIADGIDQYLHKSLVKDYDIAITDIQDVKPYENVDELDNVSDAYAQHVNIAETVIGNQSESFGVIGVDDLEAFDSFYSGITLQQDAKEQLNKTDNGIILDEYQLERFNLQIGDEIVLQPLDQNLEPMDGKDTKVTAAIVGSMESLGFSQNRATALVNLNYFHDHFMETMSQINLKAIPDADLEQLKQDIRYHYPDSDMSVHTFDDILETQKSTIDSLILGMTIIVLLGLLIGILGISNNLLVSFIQRKKEYAVLYSVCMSRGQLVKVLLVETCLTFISVVVIGFAGSMAMNVIMVRLLYAIGLRIDFQFNSSLFFILTAVVFILLLLSILSIIRKIYRMNIIENLRFE
ncbi:ABC transporter permease [Ornithinibacillus gellani]|nr:ABC transporter permease [Ornithinibacillus gellani]